MALTPSQGAQSATNSGAPDRTIRPMTDPNMGDQDVRDFPSNGAIPDEIRALIPPSGYHVP